MCFAMQPTNGKGSSKAGAKAAAGVDMALAERQLAAARQLAALIDGAGGSAAAAALPADAGAAAQYLAALQASLQADVAYLQEVSPSREASEPAAVHDFKLLLRWPHPDSLWSANGHSGVHMLPQRSAGLGYVDDLPPCSWRSGRSQRRSGCSGCGGRART